MRQSLCGRGRGCSQLPSSSQTSRGEWCGHVAHGTCFPEPDLPITLWALTSDCRTGEAVNMPRLTDLQQV